MTKHLLYRNLYHWFERNHRTLPWRETTNPYHIWVSEIILQQTRVAQGLEYYLRFIHRFPSVEDLAQAEEDEVLLYWQGLGYYSRARNLHKGAKLLAHKPFPDTFEQLRTIPGVGDYTAGAIASFAYNLPHPALDGNVYRVLSRLFDCDIPFDTTLGKHTFHQLAEDLLDRSQPRLFNTAIMEFGALFCTPQTPDCRQCPLQTFCKAFANNTVDLLPVRKPRPTLKNRYLRYTIYLEKSNNNLLTCRTLIHQRTKKDIWHHLWEFPLEESNTPFNSGLTLTHTLSHQRLHATFVLQPVETRPTIPDTRTIRLGDLQDYALPRLILRALEQILPALAQNPF